MKCLIQVNLNSQYACNLNIEHLMVFLFTEEDDAMEEDAASDAAIADDDDSQGMLSSSKFTR